VKNSYLNMIGVAKLKLFLTKFVSPETSHCNLTVKEVCYISALTRFWMFALQVNFILLTF